MLLPAFVPDDKKGNCKDMDKNIIGIDISKAHLDMFDQNGQTHRQWDNTARGIGALIKGLLKREEECQLIFEATGPYHKALEAGLVKAGIAYTQVNPWQARRFAEATGQRTKTDKVDAKMLALMGQALGLNPSLRRDRVYEDLAEIEGMRLAMVDQRTAWKNRQQMLTSKAHQRFVAREIKRCDQALEHLNQEAMALLKEHPKLERRWQILCSIKGIGRASALSILTNLPEIGILNQSQVAALSGLAPRERSSGNWKGKTRISGGRANLRKALYMPALVATRYNQDLKEFYTRLLEMGKPKMVALIAVMRKLIIIANSLIKNDRKWTQTRP